MLNTLETFSVLSETKIEGIESIANRFHHMYSTLKKKPYDPLDHRKPDFEADFFEFKRQSSDIKVGGELYCICTYFSLCRWSRSLKVYRPVLLRKLRNG